MVDLVQVLGILEDARGTVAENWWDGTFENDGNYCALTAIGRLGRLKGLDGPTPAFRAAEYVARQMGVSPWNIPEFNDSHSHAEVLAAFDKAIATVKADMGDPILDPTPNADMALAVMEACESAGEVVARQIVSTRPDLDFENVAEVAASEIFYAAQDTAWAFEMGVKPVRA